MIGATCDGVRGGRTFGAVPPAHGVTVGFIFDFDAGPALASFLADTDRILLADGSDHGADIVILCTGYMYSFPFLREETSGVAVTHHGKV